MPFLTQVSRTSQNRLDKRNVRLSRFIPTMRMSEISLVEQTFTRQPERKSTYLSSVNRYGRRGDLLRRPRRNRAHNLMLIPTYSPSLKQGFNRARYAGFLLAFSIISC